MSQRICYVSVTLFLLIATVIPAVAQRQPISAEGRLPIGGQNLGDSFADLVYTPLNPCRIIDTRVAGGVMAGGSTRSFIVKGTNAFQTQGGTVGGCGVPTTATSVLLNFVAVTPEGLGNLKGAAYPNAIPTTGSILNYQALNPALNIANAVAFPVCDSSVNTCTFDITLLANGGGTDVVVDVLGYFKRFPTEQTITQISAGTGLTGGGTSGNVVLGIADSGVGTTQIANNAVTTAQIIDGAVTTSKIAASAVNASKVSDEPGAALVEGPSFTTLTTLFTLVTISSATINAPAAGYVVATSSGYVNLFHTTGTNSSIYIDTEPTATGFPLDYGTSVINVPAAFPTTAGLPVQIPFSSSRRFTVASAGPFTVYLVARLQSGSTSNEVAYPSLVVTYYPRGY